jgi:hypothetical protein
MGLNRDMCKRRYYDLKAQRCCVRCAQKLPEGEKRVRCIECHTDMLLSIDRKRGEAPKPEPRGKVARCRICSLTLPHVCVEGSALDRRAW